MTKLLEEALERLKELSETRQDSIAAMILQEIEADEEQGWDEFDQILEDAKMATGIPDLSYQHDHYLHGISKKLIE